MNFSPHTITVITAVIVIYFALVMILGIYFSRFSSNINDFFFSGQRFSWWVPTMSMVATGIGSYSYIKYSEQGFNTGANSTHIYFNDWFLFPVFLFAWLPLLYFNRIKSVPEYFEKRFNPLARYVCVFLILFYIFYYIGFNLFTMGVAIEGAVGIPAVISLPFITFLLAVYVTIGGQTAVIFTDVFQGIILYIVGLIIIVCGFYALGGFSEFWDYLPKSHRQPLAPLNSNEYNTVGIFWGDAMAGGIAFLYMNQGFLMRFLTIKNVSHARMAAMANLVITLPLSALVIGGTGWIAKAVLTKQKAVGAALQGYEWLTIDDSRHTFLLTAFEVIQRNEWIIGFIFAALLAALMSTVDSLITAAAAIGIYDIYKPLFRPQADEKHYLKTARFAALASAIIGLLLVVWFYTQEDTLMSIHYKGIMLIIPPVVTTVFFGIFWRKFNAFSACVSMMIGVLAAFLTLVFPQPVYWMREVLMGLPPGEDIVYFRAPFGIAVTAVSGWVIQILTSKKDLTQVEFKKRPYIGFLIRGLESIVRFTALGSNKNVEGLTADSVKSAMRSYKKGEPNLQSGSPFKNLHFKIDESLNDDEIVISKSAGEKLNTKAGDFIYLADERWYLGGVRSGHFRLKRINDDKQAARLVYISKKGCQRSYLLEGKKVFIEKTI